MISFGDAADPALLVADYKYAALYSADCEYPCPPEVAKNWAPVNRRWITFAGDPECSIIDYEKYTQNYADPLLLRNWLDMRASNKSSRHAWLYSDLSNTPQAAHWARGLPFQWWIATDDNIQRSPGELAALMLAWGCPAEYAKAELIAANQWHSTSAVDGSSCFVNTNW